MDIIDIVLGGNRGGNAGGSGGTTLKTLHLADYTDVAAGKNLNTELLMAILFGGGKIDIDTVAFLADCNGNEPLCLVMDTGESTVYVSSVTRIRTNKTSDIEQVTFQFCAVMGTTHIVNVCIYEGQVVADVTTKQQ